jgi:hypothetical protein
MSCCGWRTVTVREPWGRGTSATGSRYQKIGKDAEGLIVCSCDLQSVQNYTIIIRACIYVLYKLDKSDYHSKSHPWPLRILILITTPQFLIFIDLRVTTFKVGWNVDRIVVVADLSMCTSQLVNWSASSPDCMKRLRSRYHWLYPHYASIGSEVWVHVTADGIPTMLLWGLRSEVMLRLTVSPLCFYGVCGLRLCYDWLYPHYASTESKKFFFHSMLFPRLEFSFTLKMEEKCSSEASVDIRWTTWPYVPKVGNFLEVFFF